MNAKSVILGLSLAVAVFAVVFFYFPRRTSAQQELQRQAAELTESKVRLAALEQKLALAEKERDRFKADAAEVHRLRGELSTLRKANESLEKQAAQKPRETVVVQPPDRPNQVAQALQGHYPELAQQISTLRKKLNLGAPLDADEIAWLKQMKPELDKLESSPQDFASFQAAMIQNVAGVTDPEKVEKIRQAVQKVYENAVNRGLTIDRRPADDPVWIEQRHQLDRRGTAAVQNILDENERAAFDGNFLGIMGADLGTGVDKTLYPPGFLRD
jgi:hypothetical protein